MDSLRAPPGWSAEAPIVRHMPVTLLRLPRTEITRAKFPAIDFHVHARGLTSTAAYEKAVQLMDATGLGAIVNLNAGTGAELDAVLKAGAPYRHRVANFITFSADGINAPGWSEKFAAEMERAFKAGVVGMKVSKALGLQAKNPDGTFIQADDPRLDPVWAMAAKYDKPIMIHLGDSIGRFYPISPRNERYEAGLWHRPGDTSFNYYNNGSPSLETIERARENMHRKHPKTRFVNAHLAMLSTIPASWPRFSTRFRTPTSRSPPRCRTSGGRRGSGASSSSNIKTASSWAPTAASSAGSTISGRRTGGRSRLTMNISSTRRRSGPRAARPVTAAGTSPASACPTRCCEKSIIKTRSATCRRCAPRSSSSSPGVEAQGVTGNPTSKASIASWATSEQRIPCAGGLKRGRRGGRGETKTRGYSSAGDSSFH